MVAIESMALLDTEEAARHIARALAKAADLKAIDKRTLYLATFAALLTLGFNVAVDAEGYSNLPPLPRSEEP